MMDWNEMFNNEFFSWIQGYTNLSDDGEVSPRQLRIIKNHARLVSFIDPDHYDEVHQFLCALGIAERVEQPVSMVDLRRLAESPVGSV